jgi:hypothetical protein
LEKGRDRHLASRLPYCGQSASVVRNRTVRSRLPVVRVLMLDLRK